MEEREIENLFAIPANYTDSGKLLGGLLSLRNIIEAIILVVGIGFVELKLIPMPETVRIIVMVVTLLPLALIALVGIDGESLFQYLGHICRFIRHRRQLHFRRIGGNYESEKR